jgi:hypothetical protein
MHGTSTITSGQVGPKCDERLTAITFADKSGGCLCFLIVTNGKLKVHFSFEKEVQSDGECETNKLNAGRGYYHGR